MRMDIKLTPGLALLLRGLPHCLVPVCVVLSLQQLGARFAITVPTYLQVVAWILSVPIYTTIVVASRLTLDKFRAISMGAALPPLVCGNVIGNVDVLRTLVHNFKHGYPGDGLWEMCEKLGPVFNLRVLWQDLVFTTDPNHIKMVLATDFNNFVKGERFQRVMNSVLGTGVFNSDGDMWQFHRSMTKKFFTKDRISHFEIFDRHADEAIKQVRRRVKEGYAIDIQDVMSRFTLDSATEFLFGSCVHSLSADLPYPHNVTTPESLARSHNSADDFAEAFRQAQYLISERERLGIIWPLYELFYNKTDKPMQVVNAYLQPIINEAVNKQMNAPGTDRKMKTELDDDETVLDHLVKLTSDPVLLKDETLNIMIAGRDTTAATLSFIIYLLAIHSHVLTRLREEILTKIGPSRMPTSDDIRELKYLRAVINETMRLYPAVPFNVRESVNATTWPSPDPMGKPIYVPRKTKISYSVLMMHRRKDLWGPDADEFDPDRFLDHRLQKYLVHNPFIFLPFNAGPRICLGQQFAYNEVSFMIIRLLQTFSSITLDPDAQPPESRPPGEWAKAGGRKAIERIFPKSHLTMYINGGLWVRMDDAEGPNATHLV